MVIAQHERDARNQGQGGTLKLGVATSDGNEGICVMTSGTAYHLAAFFVRFLGHGTCVHNVDVGLVVDVDALKAQLTESAAYVGRLAKVEFAPQGVDGKTFGGTGHIIYKERSGGESCGGVEKQRHVLRGQGVPSFTRMK